MLPQILKTTRLFFRILALPYCSLISAGFFQAAKFASAYHAWRAAFASGKRFPKYVSCFFDITLIYLYTIPFLGSRKKFPNREQKCVSYYSLSYNFLPLAVIAIIHNIAIDQKFHRCFNDVQWHNEPFPWRISFPITAKNIEIQAGFCKKCMQ